MPKLSVVILTYNEELHIARAIRSLRQCPAVTDIYVVDSHSTDNTRSIAELEGAQVFEHDFVNQAKQLQWALDSLPIATEWTMRLDADELIGADLAYELATAVATAADNVGGFTLNRRHIFLGKWIKHGGRFPMRLLRVWRTGNGRVEDRWMDEHIVIKDGATLDLKGKFEDRNLQDLHFFTEKHNSYATREALAVLMSRYGQKAYQDDLYSLSPQAKLKRFVKERVYNRLPYQVTAFSYFSFRYFLQLGVLDGPQGLVYHFLQACWYRFLVGAKLAELKLTLAKLPSDELKLEELNRVVHKLTMGNPARRERTGTEI